MATNRPASVVYNVWITNALVYVQAISRIKRKEMGITLESTK